MGERRDSEASSASLKRPAISDVVRGGTWENVGDCTEGRFDRGYLGGILEDVRIVLLEQIHLLNA
jgi:hypothetical protein